MSRTSPPQGYDDPAAICGIYLPRPSKTRKFSSLQSSNQADSVLPSTEWQERHALDCLDPEGCILTNVHSHWDQVSHIINAQKTDLQEKENLERFLKDTGVFRENWHLEHISNIVWMSAGLRISTEKHDHFTIALTELSAQRLVDCLTMEFNDRQRIMDTEHRFVDRDTERVLAHSNECEYQMIALYPFDLLPNGLPLARRRSGNQNIYDIYAACPDDNLIRKFDASNNTYGDVFPAFRHVTKRAPANVFNPYAIALASTIKYLRFKHLSGILGIPPIYRLVFELRERIVHLIHKPVQPTKRFLHLAATQSLRNDDLKQKGMAPNHKVGKSSDEEMGVEGQPTDPAIQKLPLRVETLMRKNIEYNYAARRDYMLQSLANDSSDLSEEDEDLLPIFPLDSQSMITKVLDWQDQMAPMSLDLNDEADEEGRLVPTS